MLATTLLVRVSSPCGRGSEQSPSRYPFFREDSSMQAKRIFVGPCLTAVFLWTTCAVASGFQVQLPARADDQSQEPSTAKQPVNRVQVDDEPGTAKQRVKKFQVNDDEPGAAKQRV